MRDPLILPCAALVAGLLVLSPALAEPATGWVDPPAKPAAQGTGAAGPERPAEAAAPASASRSQAGSAPTTTVESARGAQDGITEKPAARREARRGHARTGHRLVFTPPAAAAPTSDDPRFAEWAGRAQRLTLDYLDSVSAPNAASLAEAPRFYGARVRRFGRNESLAAVLADKRRFANRWPDRRYTAQPGTVKTSCNAALKTCIVQATLDYRARNPLRGTRSQGVAELVLEISFADERPVIVSETGRVLRRAVSAGVVDAKAEPGA